MGPTIYWVIGILCGGAFVGLLVVVAGERLMDSIAWLFGRREGGLAGVWRAVYEHVEPGEESDPVTETVAARQLGDRLVGRRVQGGRPGAGRLVRVRAREWDDGFLTGVWFDVKDRTPYHGPFQLRLSPDGRRLVGRWVSYDREGMNWESGSWIWTRQA